LTREALQVSETALHQDTPERFDFTWEGNDECDEAFGSGWLILKSADELEGSIGFLGGDRSAFAARRA
jgi:hypothetical protein